MMFYKGKMNDVLELMLRKCMMEQLGEDHEQKYPGLYEKLDPKYEAGCKRMLISNDWIPAMKQKNVELVTDGIKELTKEGIVSTKDTFKPDVLIYGTGFQANDLLMPLPGVIKGKNGITLKEKWAGKPRAWMGMTVPEFPNFCMLYGPNTNLGHNSIVFMMECQMDYIVKLITHAVENEKKAFDTDQDAYDQINDEF